MLLLVRLNLGFILRETAATLLHTFLLGSPNERVIHAIRYPEGVRLEVEDEQILTLRRSPHFYLLSFAGSILASSSPFLLRDLGPPFIGQGVPQGSRKEREGF